jgi:predicted transcriptional regulator
LRKYFFSKKRKLLGCWIINSLTLQPGTRKQNEHARSTNQIKEEMWNYFFSKKEAAAIGILFA